VAVEQRSGRDGEIGLAGPAAEPGRAVRPARVIGKQTIGGKDGNTRVVEKTKPPSRMPGFRHADDGLNAYPAQQRTSAPKILRTGNWAVRGSSDSLTPKAGATMSTIHQIERNRGTKDSRQQLAVLREKWPLAFPAEHQDVRPLAIGAAREIAAEMNWSLPYTLGVLVGWKMAAVYCQAVLCYDQRVALDGSPAETIDAEAKDLATKQLARLAARETAKKATKAAAPGVMKPKPNPVPPTAQLRARVRGSLLRRSA
jgi:hypothetical protein